MPWALNYLAFSHFIHWPEDSLLDFGRKTLGQTRSSEAEGERFVRTLAAWEAGDTEDAVKTDTHTLARQLGKNVESGKNPIRWRYWNWLDTLLQGVHERHTTSFF